jgi:hypothetical protein
MLENYEPISNDEADSINVATEEGMRRLAERWATDGPIFRVLHACDRREES